MHIPEQPIPEQSKKAICPKKELCTKEERLPEEASRPQGAGAGGTNEREEREMWGGGAPGTGSHTRCGSARAQTSEGQGKSGSCR